MGIKVKQLSLPVIILFLVMLSYAVSTNSALAEEESKGNTDDIKVEIIHKKSELSPSDKTTLTALIHNNKKTPITVNKIELGPIPFEKTEHHDKEILSNSSKPIFVDLTIPQDIKPGTYQIVATVTDNDGLTGIGWTEITIKTKSSLAENVGLHLDGILLLLAVYVIPAQFVERIIEVIKKRHLDDKDHKLSIQNDEEIKSLTKIRDKLADSIASNAYKSELREVFGTKIKPDLLKRFLLNNDVDDKTASSVVQSLTEKEDPLTAYDKFLKNLDEKIADVQRCKNGHEIKHETRMWLHALWISAAPGIVLSLANIGVFQIVGHQGNMALVGDSIINSLFIGSGTKPIHDIIEWVKKARAKS